MDVALYASDHGTLILVPACMHPAQEAERRHGPLRMCGQAHLNDLPDIYSRARIEADIDQSAYAMVNVHEAQSLLGVRHPCFRHRQTGLWPRLHRKRHASVRT
jgi:hypothetical protein